MFDEDLVDKCLYILTTVRRYFFEQHRSTVYLNGPIQRNTHIKSKKETRKVEKITIKMIGEKRFQNGFWVCCFYRLKIRCSTKVLKELTIPLGLRKFELEEKKKDRKR